MSISKELQLPHCSYIAEIHSNLRLKKGPITTPIVLAGEVVSGLSKDLMLIGRTMRPLDWIKNLFVFAPIFFSGEATQIDKLALVSLVFLAFSAMSSAGIHL